MLQKSPNTWSNVSVAIPAVWVGVFCLFVGVVFLSFPYLIGIMLSCFVLKDFISGGRYLVI